jgi:hypothetical protein
LIYSTTDNIAINTTVGALTSAAAGILQNPLLVIRTRVQVMARPAGVRLFGLWIARDIIRHEGVSGLFRGLRTNVLLQAGEGAVFGTLYESTKFFADTSQH